MKVLFEFSKEQKILPCDEILATLETENCAYKIIEKNEDVLIIDIKSHKFIIQRLAGRLAYTFIIDELLFSCSPTLNDIAWCAKKHPLKRSGSVAIRCKNYSKIIQSQKVVDCLGEFYTKDRLVNLTNPTIEMRIVITKNQAYVGIKKAVVKTSLFQQRRGHLRPFLSPVTLHPKVARALVNLSVVKKQETLLDPFCGTGGILLEAGLLGIKVIGSDIEEKMIEGCQINLEFYHIKDFTLYCTDISNISKHINIVDAVVTDFPYGRSSTTKGEQLTQLSIKAFQSISQILKKNGHAVIGLSRKELVTIGERYLSIVKIYPMKSHRSLIRYFVVYKNL